MELVGMSEFRDFIAELEGAFVPRDYQSMWFQLNAKYKSLGFSDAISDEQRIREYEYIVKQFRKYISSQKDTFMECRNAEDMLALINDRLDNAKEYGSSRSDLVYNFVKDDWLHEIQGYLINWMYYEKTEEDE
jgi:hypothetical protein